MVNPWDFSVLQIIAVAGLGLVAGTLGGMLGVGGSIIMIPGLVMLFGIQDEHLFQASAMIANVAVAAPAAWKHYKSGGTTRHILIWMMPFAIAFVFLGVYASNLFTGPSGARWLGRLLAVFLIYVVYANARKLMAPAHHVAAAEAEAWQSQKNVNAKSGGIGAGMGLLAGLLGIGGGALAVPMQQVLLKLPLRNCIANSSVAMVFSASVGAIMKSATLPQHGAHYGLTDGLELAALLIPTAIIGGRLGASLTYVLPVKWIRAVFVVLMAVAAWKMASIPLPW